MRGEGGIILDGDGKRCVNELGTRDYVSGILGKSKGPFRLCLNSEVAKSLEWHVHHYKERGQMKK